jgi:hypothetical protein
MRIEIDLTTNEITEHEDAPVDYDAPVITELTPQEKLANAGLSVDELKTLLGIA